MPLEIPNRSTAGVASAATTAISIMPGFAITHAAAFGLALTTAEITGGTMVIADWLRTKLVAPLQDSLREERARGSQRQLARLESSSQGSDGARRTIRRTGTLWQRRVAGRSNCRHTSICCWKSWNAGCSFNPRPVCDALPTDLGMDYDESWAENARWPPPPLLAHPRRRPR